MAQCPEQLLAVLAFDRWVGNADGRQTFFFRAQLNDWLARPGIPPRYLGFVALLIDHGFAFIGPHWFFTDSAVTVLYPRRIVYEGVRATKDFEPWIDRILHFPEAVFDKALRQIPPPWIEGDENQLEALLESLLRRRQRIPELLEDCRKAPEQPVPSLGDSPIRSSGERKHGRGDDSSSLRRQQNAVPVVSKRRPDLRSFNVSDNRHSPFDSGAKAVPSFGGRQRTQCG